MASKSKKNQSNARRRHETTQDEKRAYTQYVKDAQAGQPTVDHNLSDPNQTAVPLQHPGIIYSSSQGQRPRVLTTDDLPSVTAPESNSSKALKIVMTILGVAVPIIGGTAYLLNEIHAIDSKAIASAERLSHLQVAHDRDSGIQSEIQRLLHDVDQRLVRIESTSANSQIAWNQLEKIQDRLSAFQETVRIAQSDVKLLMERAATLEGKLRATNINDIPQNSP